MLDPEIEILALSGTVGHLENLKSLLAQAQSELNWIQGSGKYDLTAVEAWSIKSYADSIDGLKWTAEQAIARLSDTINEME